MTKGSAFISYRREDTAGYAGRLYDRLNARFPDRIFMDVSGLDPGVDFVEEIQKAVGSCKALIVLIGKNWAVTADGVSRLQDPQDFVRLEVTHALERKIRVIPILVGGANLPPADTLPADISSLLRRQALKLDDAAFDYHVSQLIEVLEKDLGPAATTPAGVPPRDSQESTRPPARQERPQPVYPVYEPPRKKSRKLLWLSVGAIVAFFMLGVLGYIIQEFSTASDVDPDAAKAFIDVLQTAANTAANQKGAKPSAAPGGQNITPDSISGSKQEAPPAEGAVTGLTRPPSQSSDFNPIGRWRVSQGEGGLVSLLLIFERDGSFQAHTQGAGFSVPGSAGTWQYNPSQRLLTASGINNAGIPFQTLFQIGQSHTNHYDAFVPGTGNVVLTKE